MPRKTAPPSPVVARSLEALGEHLRLARLRRGLSAELVAARAGMARDTLRAVERGDAGVSLGSLANAMHVLGLAQGLATLASDDELGRQLQDARLDARARPSRPRVKKPPAGTVDLKTHIGAELSQARGPALVWVNSSDWIQTFLPGPTPRERAPEALRVGDRVVVKDVVSSAEPVFVLVDSAAGERVVMLGDLRTAPTASRA
jgi:transcriptional regulator with XRE-family HTH domain